MLTPLLPLADPDVTNTSNRFVRPFSDGASLGTDHLGRDLLSRMIYGGRTTIFIATVLVPSASVPSRCNDVITCLVIAISIPPLLRHGLRARCRSTFLELPNVANRGPCP